MGDHVEVKQKQILYTMITIHKRHPTPFKQQRVKPKLGYEARLMIGDIFGKCNHLHIKVG